MSPVNKEKKKKKKNYLKYLIHHQRNLPPNTVSVHWCDAHGEKKPNLRDARNQC